MAAVTEPLAPVDLAREPEFRLGALHVRPSAALVSANGRERRVQPRVMEVLVVLTRAKGETVTRDDLIEACWGGRIVSDDAVNRIIAQVRILARGIAPPPFVLETIPKVGFRLHAGEVVDEARAPARPAPRGAARIAAVAGAAALAALGGWTAWRLMAPAQTGRTDVMRFQPLGADAEVQRISVTVGDALVRRLTDAGVKTRQSVLPRDARGEASEFRISGTVERDGERYVVNAQILDRRSGDVLWSGRIDRPAATPGGFQEEAANSIADILHCALGSRSASRKPMSTAVFGMFLNACAYRRVGEDDRGKFMETTRRLVEAAPGLSVAYSMHAVALGQAVSGARTTDEARTLMPSLRGAADRALRLDPRNGEAYFALGIGAAATPGAWLDRERLFARAAALSPNLTVVRNYEVDLLRDVGRLEEARALNQRTMASDTFSAWQVRSLAFLSAAAGDWPTAGQMLDRIDLLDARLGGDSRLQTALWWRPPGEARPILRAMHAEDKACLDRYLARLEAAGASPLRGLPPECGDMGRVWRVRMLSRQGDVDGAYAEAPAALEDHDAFSRALFYPEMKAFRRDARFMPLARRLGLVDYWMKSGHWPDFCREPDLPYDCKAVARAG